VLLLAAYSHIYLVVTRQVSPYRVHV
jgi:hypothetical protein